MKSYKFIKKLFFFLKYQIYINETIVLYQLGDSVKQISPAIIQYANSSNLDDILYFKDKKTIDSFKKFLQIGDIGYFAYFDKNCIHRSWVVSNNQVVYLHQTIPYKLKDNEIFIHYSETANEARGKNVFPHVLSYIIESNKNKEILIAVNKKNLASIRAVQKVGFEEKEIIQTIVLVGIKFKRYLK